MDSLLELFCDVDDFCQAFLPFSKTAGSNAHVYWAICTGKTEFRGTKAAELRTALEQEITIPHPYEKNLMGIYIFNWLRRITMRRLGYVSHATATDETIRTQKLDLRFSKTGRVRIRQKNRSITNILH